MVYLFPSTRHLFPCHALACRLRGGLMPCEDDIDDGVLIVDTSIV
jgi:hypothetical protein